MSTGRGPRAGEQGFTLVEVLVAMGLLVVALVPMAMVLSSSLHTVGECGTTTNATTVAESLLERLHVVKFAELDPDGDGFHWPRQMVSGYPQFEAEVAVAPLGDGVAQVSARLYRRGEAEPLVVVSTVRARELPPEGGS